MAQNSENVFSDEFTSQLDKVQIDKVGDQEQEFFHTEAFTSITVSKANKIFMYRPSHL